MPCVLYRLDSSDVTVYHFDNKLSEQINQQTSDEILIPGTPELKLSKSIGLIKRLLDNLVNLGVDFQVTEVEERLKTLRDWKIFSLRCDNDGRSDTDYHIFAFLTYSGNYYVAPLLRDGFSEQYFYEYHTRQVNRPDDKVIEMTVSCYLTTSGKVYPVLEENLDEPSKDFLPLSGLPHIEHIRQSYQNLCFLIDAKNHLYYLQRKNRSQKPCSRDEMMILETDHVRVYRTEFDNVKDIIQVAPNIIVMLFHNGDLKYYKDHGDVNTLELIAEIHNIHEMKKLLINKLILATIDGKIIVDQLHRSLVSFTDLPWEGFWTLNPPINPRVKSA